MPRIDKYYYNKNKFYGHRRNKVRLLRTAGSGSILHPQSKGCLHGPAFSLVNIRKLGTLCRGLRFPRTSRLQRIKISHILAVKCDVAGLITS